VLRLTIRLILTKSKRYVKNLPKVQAQLLESIIIY
jgi:hypothetical protein